ncbi:MAG: 1-phosphofructokinase family hexose kinase [Phycisphaerales bacterium]
MPAIRIVTVTLNPAVDRVLEAPQFRVNEHVRARHLGWYPGGKGINLARSLGILGSRAIATGFIGRGELGMFEENLEHVAGGRVITQLLIVRGRTRDNVTIMDPVLDTETHIRAEGFSVQRDDVRRITSKVRMLSRPGAIVAFGGSLPPGTNLGDLRSMLHAAEDHGALTVVDTSASALAALRGEPMWLAKLNNQELSTLAGMPTGTRDETIAAARGVTRRHGGSVQHVIATRGAEGAIYIGPDHEFEARAFVHPGLVASTVGCGDALLAGVLHEYTRSGDWKESMRLGVAVATANAVSRERGVFSMQDVGEYLGVASVEEIGHAAASGAGGK